MSEPVADSRLVLADRIRTALCLDMPGSSASVRGSLADGSADAFSDIDLQWIVPDGRFAATVDRAPVVIGRVAGRVLWCRSDPDVARSAGRRMLTLRLRDLPLFWRIDLEIRAASFARAGDEPAPGSVAPADAPASALEHAIAAIKALARAQPNVARGLLDRGYVRLGDQRPGDRSPADAALALARAAALRDPDLEPLAAQVEAVLDAVARATG